MSIETDDSKNTDHEKQLINHETNKTMNEIAAKIQKVKTINVRVLLLSF